MPAILEAEGGSGMLGTAIGLAVFVAFLFVSTHVLAHLYVTSAVDGVVHDLAIEVSGVGEGSCASAVPRGRALLGAYADSVTIECRVAHGQVVVTADARSLGLAPPGLGGVLDSFERTARLTLEDPEAGS